MMALWIHSRTAQEEGVAARFWQVVGRFLCLKSLGLRASGFQGLKRVHFRRFGRVNPAQPDIPYPPIMTVHCGS